MTEEKLVSKTSIASEVAMAIEAAKSPVVEIPHDLPLIDPDLAEDFKKTVLESVRPQQSVLAMTVATIIGKFISGTVKNKVVRVILLVTVTSIGAYFSATANGEADVNDIIQAIASAVTTVLTGG